MRLEKHVEHCRSIAEYLDSIVNGEIFTDPCGGEWVAEYEPAYGFEMYTTHSWVQDGERYKKVAVTLTTTDGETYKRSDTNETIEDIEEYLTPFELWDYFNDSVYNLEYRVPSRDEDPTSVQIMVACGGPNIYIDTKSGEVELYWWSESGSYPMRRETACAIEEYFIDLYNC